MNPRLLTIVLACCTALHAPARAQFAVIDVANLAQALEQVMAWQKQYQQMTEQQQQLKQQYAAATGNRGLGNLANDPRLQATVPADLQQIYDTLHALGARGLNAEARALRDRSKVYDCDQLNGDDLLNCQRLLSILSQHQALLRSALALTSQRASQVRTLQDRINSTDDPKSISELQARLQAEAIQVSNDANRLLLMRGMAEAADRSAEQAVREATLRSLSRHDNGSATFKFVLRQH